MTCLLIGAFRSGAHVSIFSSNVFSLSNHSRLYIWDPEFCHEMFYFSNQTYYSDYSVIRGVLGHVRCPLRRFQTLETDSHLPVLFKNWKKMWQWPLMDLLRRSCYQLQWERQNGKQLPWRRLRLPVQIVGAVFWPNGQLA